MEGKLEELKSFLLCTGELYRNSLICTSRNFQTDSWFLLVSPEPEPGSKSYHCPVSLSSSPCCFFSRKQRNSVAKISVINIYWGNFARQVGIEYKISNISLTSVLYGWVDRKWKFQCQKTQAPCFINTDSEHELLSHISVLVQGRRLAWPMAA